MLLTISGLLEQASLERIAAMLAGAPFVDGKLSAGMTAAKVKQNEEVAADAAHINALNALVMKPLVAHPTFKLGVLPQRVAVPYYARYRAGMAYGLHVDDPVMGPADGRYRSDVSVTVFLNEPNDYTGGELMIQGHFGEQAIKLAAGDAVIYPSSSLHRVAEVTSGERLVAVTWIQSMIRDPAQRAILYDLGQLRETALQQTPQSEDTQRLDRAYVNLVRMWAEV